MRFFDSKSFRRQALCQLLNVIGTLSLLLLLVFPVDSSAIMNYSDSSVSLQLDGVTYSDHDSGEGYRESSSGFHFIACEPPPSWGACDTGTAKSSVDPVNRSMKAYVHIDGDGANTGPFGSYLKIYGYTVGYYANMYKIDPGSSGLSVGDPVQVLFRTLFDGVVSSSMAPGSTNNNERTAASQVFHVTNPGAIDTGFLNSRVSAFGNWEVEGTLGTSNPMGDLKLFYSSNDPIPIGGPPPFSYDPVTGAFSYDSGEQAVDLHVGDSIFVENYFLLYSAINADLPSDNQTELDFWNTYNSPITFAPGYAGLQLTSQPLTGGTPPVVPEPVSSVLFISGGALLSVRNFMKKRRMAQDTTA